MTTDSGAFSLDKPRYDQRTFFGRYAAFRDQLDIFTLFTSEKKLQESLGLLQQYETGTLPSTISDDELWEAKRIRDSILHPDTGKPIFPIFRFSFFALAQIPICGVLLVPNPSFMLTLFGQWLNNSYNVCVNYENRNASNNIETELLVGSYAIATGTSCSIALGIRHFTKNYTSSLARVAMPFLSVLAAGVTNLFVIRYNEMQDGIDITNETGSITYGKSVIAGRDAIMKCCVARFVWLTPMLVAPPFLMDLLGKVPLIRKSPKIRFVSEIAIIGGIAWAVMPMALAVFPQKDSLSINDIEPHFKKSIPVGTETVFFNKGL